MSRVTKMTTARLGHHHVDWLRQLAEEDGDLAMVEACRVAKSAGQRRIVGAAQKVVVDEINRRQGYVARSTPKKTPAQLDREIEAIAVSKPSKESELARARDVSERRIAALRANGEDVRNSPAWRDAMHESRAIGLWSGASRSGSRATVDRSNHNRSSHARVDFRWYAVPNENKSAGGFLPMIEEDGRRRGDTWSGRHYSKAEAEAMAEEKAHEAASRFVGDWNVVVTKGQST